MIQLIEKKEDLSIEKFNKNDLIKKFEVNPFYKILFYYAQNEIWGYLSFQHIYDRIEIDDFFVLPENRRNKIGTHLFNELIDYSIKHKISNITLEVRENNNIAISFYKKYGFEEKAIRKNYYRETDGILMEKEMIQWKIYIY